MELYSRAVEKVKAGTNQEQHDYLGRRLYDMTGEIIMSLLLINDASKAPELFAKSARLYTRLTEEHVVGHAAFIESFDIADLEDCKFDSVTKA